MANRNFDVLQALGKNIKVICGSFAPNGGSAVSSSSVKGLGFSVARTGAGIFTITLQDSYVDVVAVQASLQLATPDDKMLQWGAIDVVTAKTLVLNVWDFSGAAVADIAANASNRIHFSLYLRNSTVL